MKPSSPSKRRPDLLARGYGRALRRYLQQGRASDLAAAVRLGHRAVRLGLETLDLTVIHERVLVSLVRPTPSAGTRDHTLRRAGAFFARAILPVEERHRSALEANARLHRLNAALRLRTLDLAASNRKLEREIAKRKAAEMDLRQSEQHSRQLLSQSQRLQGQLRLLSRRILMAQEEERRRISRELHDVVAQMLTGINVRLATLRAEAVASTNGLGQKISRTQRLVERSVDAVHRFARDLRPAMLDDLGLISALHTFMKRFAKETGVRMSLTASAGLETLSTANRTVLFRVAQEALSNVARHAQAARVDVRIQKLPHAVCMQIRDDGKSFDVARVFLAGRSRKLGLLGMRERVEMVGGRFLVESAPGRGTTIQAEVPFGNGAPPRSRP